MPQTIERSAVIPPEAAGQRLDQVLVSLGHVAEGVYCARAVLHRAQRLQVDMPITAGVVRLLDGEWTPQQAVFELMGRAPRPGH